VTVAVFTIPPRNDLTKLNTINTWNRWLKTLCRDRNLHLIDAYDVLVDRTTGAFAAGHGAPDGIHISPLGHNKVGALFAATMVPRVIASSPLEPHTNSDTGNLLANGLLLTGSPLPTSWVVTGGATTGFAPRRPRRDGVRRILNNAADRALATRHAEAWYVATVLATAAASWALLTIARALTAATKETP
jgi:hypothetical protein